VMRSHVDKKWELLYTFKEELQRKYKEVYVYIYHIMFDKPIPTIAHKSNRNITHAVYNGEEIGPD